ncbi:hypothetical protein BDN67DRAFT_982930 [Paxillus ammoniavirescens]|nr:hypothetical protein BDN67DRAFT_982930 [Paxillus ammoniavirescens]
MFYHFFLPSVPCPHGGGDILLLRDVFFAQISVPNSFGHKLNVVWTTDLGPEVYQPLDFEGVLWTSIDVVRYIKVGEGEAVGPVVLGIGVAAEFFWGENPHTSFRESIYTLLAGPNLIEPASDLDPDVDVRGPLTPALGLSIAAQATPRAEGTGGIYLAEGGDSKKVLLVTACHVLFPPNDVPNVLLGTKAFDNFIDSIKVRIGRHSIMAERHEQQIEKLQKPFSLSVISRHEDSGYTPALKYIMMTEVVTAVNQSLAPRCLDTAPDFDREDEDEGGASDDEHDEYHRPWGSTDSINST